MKLYTELSTQASTRAPTNIIDTMAKQIEDIKGIYQESLQETSDIKLKIKQLEDMKKIEINKLKTSIKRFQSAISKQREKESLIKVATSYRITKLKSSSCSKKFSSKIRKLKCYNKKANLTNSRL